MNTLRFYLLGGLHIGGVHNRCCLGDGYGYGEGNGCGDGNSYVLIYGGDGLGNSYGYGDGNGFGDGGGNGDEMNVVIAATTLVID